MPEPELPETLFTHEQNVIDWLADIHMMYLKKATTPIFAHRALAEKVQDLLYLATGRKYEVRQILPPPTRPRDQRNGRREWR